MTSPRADHADHAAHAARADAVTHAAEGAGSGPEPAVVTDAPSRLGWRLMATCLVLTGVAFIQAPGLLVADTKLDLAVAPLDFLARATHLWDPEGAFGQLQNQAYGYLWPMGPFFALGDLIGMPGWVVQRAWEALVLCVALVGAARLVRALGVRSDLACILGGLAYALSPRMLTVIGPSSIEVWPMALAPWVLLPLVLGAERGSARRAAALSALAIAMVGGVNAAATSAVLPLGALWLLTREPGRRRRTMIVWWPAFTLLATLWWLVPLFVLGGYSPPFLDYIESAANTTFPTTLFDALRGTSNWVAYVDTTATAGNDLLRQPHLIANSAVVLVLGLAGLALPRNRHRAFLVSGVLVGLFLVTMGHLGQVQGWAAPALQELLDGSLAPLRNVHKFDPVIRLPLVIGLAFAVEELLTRARAAARSDDADAASRRVSLRVLVGTCAFAVVGAALPAGLARLAPADGFETIPDYWSQAADWLAADRQQGTALLVPGSSFGTYVWGTPRDEPFQTLASTPWAVRNAVPLAPPGNIRMLDSVEARLAQGRGGVGLTRLLGRSGVSHLVVRNDLVRTPDVPDPVLVHQALASSPGLRRVATFGPDIGGAPRIEGDLGKAMVNGGWQDEVPAIEVYAVADAVRPAAATDRPTVVVGGPEDLADLTGLGLLGSAPSLLGVDAAQVDYSDRVLLTDGLRAVERSFGRLHDSTSPTRYRDQERTLLGRAADYELGDPDRWSTWAELSGAVSVTASSSQSDANASGAVLPGTQPYAALDDDPDSVWLSGPGAVLGDWWQVDLGEPRALGRLSVTVGDEGNEVLRVRTDDWESPLLRFEPGDTRTVDVPGVTSTIRIEDQSGRPDNRLAIADVSARGIDVVRRLVLPALPDGAPAPAAIVLRRLADARTGCAEVDEVVRCRAFAAVPAEEPRSFARRFELPAPMTAVPEVSVRADPGAGFDDYLFDQQPISVSASSVVTDDPRARGVAAVDGDAATTWTADLDDVRPDLELSWLGRRTITGLALTVERGTAAREPQSVRLTWPGGAREVELDDDGAARFAPIRTSRLTLEVLEAEAATDISFDGVQTPVPVGITELRLTGLPLVPVLLPTDERSTRCGAGPRIDVDGRTIRTRVVATPADLFAGGAGRAVPCGAGSRLDLEPGTHDVRVGATDAFVVDTVVLAGSGATGPAPGRPLDADPDGPVSVSIQAPGAGATAGTTFNANRGWSAVDDAGGVTPVVLDGWRQGWTASDAGGTLRARFGPDRIYRGGLLIGALALLVLVLLLVRPGGRRRDEDPPVGPRRWALPVCGGVGLLAGALLAGPFGLLLAAGAVVAGFVVRRYAPVVGPSILGAALLAPAAGAYLARPWGAADGWAGSLAWPHYLVLAACVVLLGVLAADSSRRSRAASRSTGTSTSR